VKFSMDAVFRVWNDDTGERIEVGEDRDGLGLTEITACDSIGEVQSAIVLTNEQLRLLGEAIQRRLEKTEGKP
jgi:hypothetical protein